MPRKKRTVKKASTMGSRRKTSKKFSEQAAIEEGYLSSLIVAVWCDPSSKKLHSSNVPGYIKGLITYERTTKANEDIINELWFLVEIWQIRATL